MNTQDVKSIGEEEREKATMTMTDQKTYIQSEDNNSTLHRL